MRMSKSWAMSAAVAIAGVVVVTGAAPVTAVTDTKRPSLKRPHYAQFVLGSTIGAAQMDPDDGTPLATSEIQLKAKWSATDASGICGFRTRDEGAGWRDPWASWGNARKAVWTASDYDDQQGGGSFKFEGVDVQVRDCAGNKKKKFVAVFPQVFQENGESYGYGTLETTSSGPWDTSMCTCWSAGSTQKTSSMDAQVTFNFSGAGMTGRHPVALVMERAPNRGQAWILIDGVYQATIDTYASEPTHRSVVWIGKMEMGPHTLTVVNRATVDRPRIDVDAVMISGR